jgi:hypothetical protein
MQNLEAIKSSIGKLNRVELEQIYRFVESLYKFDIISRLPTELALYIFILTDSSTCARAALVSKRWNLLVSDNHLWKVLYFKMGWNVNESVLDKMSGISHTSTKIDVSNPSLDCLFSTNLNSLSVDHDGYGSMPRGARDAPEFDDYLLSPDILSPGIDYDPIHAQPRHLAFVPNPLINSKKYETLDWKYIYRQKRALVDNWVKNNCVKHVIEGNSEAIYSLQFDNEKIVSCCRDSNITIWDMSSRRVRHVLKGHSGSVLCLQYNDHYLVSGASDSHIIIWDMAMKIPMYKLVGHSESVLNVKFNQEVIVSCSKDKTIKIWEWKTLKLIKTLHGHRAAINSIALTSKYIVSGSGDRTIKVWDLASGELIRTLYGHRRGIAAVDVFNNIIATGSSGITK